MSSPSIVVHHPTAPDQPAIVHARCYPPDHRCGTARSRGQRHIWPVMTEHVYPAQRLCRLRLSTGRGWTLSAGTQAWARRTFESLARGGILDARHLLRVDAAAIEAALPTATGAAFIDSLVGVAAFVRAAVGS